MQTFSHPSAVYEIDTAHVVAGVSSPGSVRRLPVDTYLYIQCRLMCILAGKPAEARDHQELIQLLNPGDYERWGALGLSQLCGDIIRTAEDPAEAVVRVESYVKNRAWVLMAPLDYGQCMNGSHGMDRLHV